MKNIKLIFLLWIVLVTLVGCGTSDPTQKGAASKHKNICIDGVTYIVFKGQEAYQGYGYMSVKFDRNSKVVTCN